jgi:hypothetical protein
MIQIHGFSAIGREPSPASDEEDATVVEDETQLPL